MRRAIARAVAEHVQMAQHVFEVCGHLTPKLWVHGQSARFAEPASREAAQATDWQRAQLLCAMRAEARGSIIGRSDEVWVRLGDDLPTLPGPLREHVDTDPSISTGLLIVALDTKHETAAGVVTRQALMDDGSAEWRLAVVPPEILERHLGVLFLADTMTCEPTPSLHADEMGWSLAWV